MSRTDLPRRALLAVTGQLAAPSLAGAQAIGPQGTGTAAKGLDGWPSSRSVSLVIPFTPGGGTDVVARILQDGFSESFGGNFVMEHKPGATTTVGARYVARARPDGTTLLVGSNSALSQAPFAYRNLGYDPLTDFTFISLLYASAYLLVAHPRWTGFAQVIETAKREPGKLSYATWGVGSTAHMLMLDLCERAGVEMLHVPFGGPAPALTEILAGRVDLMFTTFAPARGHVLEGRLNALGAPHEQRLAAVPKVPTMGELGLPEFLVSAWWCLAGPAGLTPPLAAALDQAVRVAVSRPQAQQLAGEFGLLPLPLGPQAMRARITRDLSLNEVLMRKAGITPE
ncbi:Bug family tripartite tricarboxylate transporter substrate binding protein [Dankookia rubra]|nr:tripartite tricarboxylate transporter substrate binding protein [Dankookia rubra]